MSTGNIIYEVNIHIARHREAEFDDWLSVHVRDMLGLPGFVDARAFEGEAIGDRVLRSVQYRLRDKTALDAYLKEHAAEMRAGGVQRFGEDMVAERRILVPKLDGGPVHCMNCSAPLPGQYCAACGQRHRNRMISVFELTREVFEDVISWDSRLWRSLRPLLLSPGKLTNEYLNGRRTYYTPPLRMYLVLSVLFFLLASFGTFGGINVEDFNISDQDIVIATDFEDAANGGASAAAESAGGENKFDCEDISFELDLPSVSQEAARARLVEGCQRFLAPGGMRAFFRELVDLVPKLLIVMLPLIALAGKVLYLFSRRYYVEHLLFFTHYHSFVFLFLMTMTALLWLLGWLPGDNAWLGWLRAAAWFYAVYYLFVSMRRVYGQGRFFTGVKLAAVSLTYVLGASLVALIGVLIAAFSV